jgi:hypothetical protein
MAFLNSCLALCMCFLPTRRPILPPSYAFSDWHPRADQLSADPQQILILHRVHMAPSSSSSSARHSSHQQQPLGGDVSNSAASTELPAASRRAPFMRFTSDAVDADTSFDQHCDAALPPLGFAYDVPPLRRLYSDSHSFMDAGACGSEIIGNHSHQPWRNINSLIIIHFNPYSSKFGSIIVDASPISQRNM